MLCYYVIKWHRTANVTRWSLPGGAIAVTLGVPKEKRNENRSRPRAQQEEETNNSFLVRGTGERPRGSAVLP
uniref:Secreted protein n=1 Tax=Steinernema glaseri TaxID=37863 RepID=A0A1I7ZV55_9BILA